MLSTNAAKSYFNFFFTSFVDYCRENKAIVDVERKEKVEDIADTLKRLKLLSSAASGEQQNWFTLAVKKNQINWYANHRVFNGHFFFNWLNSILMYIYH